ncbi:MAG: hypothetical protein WCV81_03820 [Microgenomates group bacterium]|jgi:hypothetical protein
MKKIKVFTYLFSLILTVCFVFSAQKASAVWNGSREGAVLLGEVTDEDSSLYGSCPNQRKIIGGSCGGLSCQGGPTYKVTWSQGTDGDSFSSGCNPDPSGKGSTFVHDEPFYTFERISIPLGTADGVPTRVSIHVDDPNFKLTKWFHKLTDNLGNDCGIPIQQGTFATPSNDQSIEIKAIRKPTSSTDDWGNCRWNHVWFSRDANAAPGSTDGSGPISAVVNLTTSGVDPNNVRPGTRLDFRVDVNGGNVPGGLASTKLFWSRQNRDTTGCPTSNLEGGGSNNIYCNVSAVPADLTNSADRRSGPNSGSFSGGFTPTIAGTYYVGPFITSHSSEVNGSARISCSGNAFCKWSFSATSCPAGINCIDCGTGIPGNTGNVTSCGGSSVKTIIVRNDAPTVTNPPSSTDRTYQYRYSVDVPFNGGDPENASYPWRSYSPAGGSDTLTLFGHTLSNPVGGKVYTVFVQFKKSDQTTTSEVSQRQITYVTPTPTPPPPTPTIPTYTTDYRCSEQSFDKDDAGSSAPQWKTYRNQDGSGAPILFNYEFTYNVVPGGNLNLFCQFRDNKGNKSPVVTKSIKYIGGQPRVTSATCTFNPLGTGTLVNVRGINIGPHDEQGSGNISVEGKRANISSWIALGRETTSSGSATQSGAVRANNDTRYEIRSSVNEKLTGGRHQIVLTLDDGTVVNGYCSLDLTTVDFTEKTTCLASGGDLSMDNVAVDIKEKVEGAKSLINKKIKIDKEGKPVDFTPGIEIGKTYVLSLKAPKTVSRRVEFVAEEGTTNLGEIVLYVGDIYPVSSPDNKVNAFDKGEMSREWAINSDVTRPGDLNNDGRVNSVDYSCLQNNYNKSGD